MPRRKQSQEIVHLPPDHPNQDMTRTDLETQPPYSPEHLQTMEAWAQYATETAMDRASYDNAVDAARYARERAYEAAREAHTKAVEEADRQFDTASTAAWKTFYSNSDSARRDRDTRLDEIRKDLTSIELQHAMMQSQASQRMAQERIAGDDGGYEVFGGMLHRREDEILSELPNGTIQLEGKYCPRCNTTNTDWADVTGDENVCPNCGQYVAPLEVLHPPLSAEERKAMAEAGMAIPTGVLKPPTNTDPETPAAPDAPAGTVGQQERATSESAAE